MPNSKDMAKIHEPAIRHPATILPLMPATFGA